MSKRILGAILAGGQSRRFGSDKALALWRGRPLIDHAGIALRPMADAIIICGRSAGIPDRPAGGRGPLAGINAALHMGLAHGFERVLTLGCDTPLVPRDLLAQLIACERAAFARECPIIGCWPVDLAASLDHFLKTDGKCSLRSWTVSIGATALSSAPILNINAPTDLTMAG